MKKTVILLIALMVISVGFLCGCNEVSNSLSGDERFVGTWEEKSTTITLFSDGTGQFAFMGFVWDIKDEKLVITIGDNELVYSYDYYFSENNSKLHLKDVSGGGDFVVYTKQ